MEESARLGIILAEVCLAADCGLARRAFKRNRRELTIVKMEKARSFFTAMSKLLEIQDAVARLPGSERKALQLWLNSQTEPELTAWEEQRLLRWLDQAA